MHKIKTWISTNIWPFYMYGQITQLKGEKADLKDIIKGKGRVIDLANADIRALTKMIGKNAITVKRHSMDGTRPIIIAYGVDNIGVFGNGEDGLVDVKYISSNPVVISRRFEPSQKLSDETVDILRQEVTSFIAEDLKDQIVNETMKVMTGEVE